MDSFCVVFFLNLYESNLNAMDAFIFIKNSFPEVYCTSQGRAQIDTKGDARTPAIFPADKKVPF